MNEVDRMNIVGKFNTKDHEKDKLHLESLNNSH